MGFCLENYFSELQAILDDTTMNAAKRLKAVKKHMAESKAYAKQCNALPK